MNRSAVIKEENFKFGSNINESVVVTFKTNKSFNAIKQKVIRVEFEYIF